MPASNHFRKAIVSAVCLAQVKLSQYRQGAGGAGASASTEGGDIPRSLLSNTDKEVIFDGLKKLYRKKVFLVLMRPIPDSYCDR